MALKIRCSHFRKNEHCHIPQQCQIHTCKNPAVHYCSEMYVFVCEHHAAEFCRKEGHTLESLNEGLARCIRDSITATGCRPLTLAPRKPDKPKQPIPRKEKEKESEFTKRQLKKQKELIPMENTANEWARFAVKQDQAAEELKAIPEDDPYSNRAKLIRYHLLSAARFARELAEAHAKQHQEQAL